MSIAFASRPRRGFVALILLALCKLTFAAPLGPLVDDFSDKNNNNLGHQRQYLNDSLAGGATQTKQHSAEGILYLSGDIVPPRGQPGWASSVLLLSEQGRLPVDASQYQGIRLVIKINKGNATVSANSSEINNFDYHAAPLAVKADGKFHEVKIPFTTMKRGWSEPVALNTKTLASISLTAYSLQKGRFEFEVDEVSFYSN